MKIHQGIRIDSIPAAGTGGFLFVLAIVVIALLGIPAVSGLAPFLLAGGILVALGRYFWNNQTRW